MKKYKVLVALACVALLVVGSMAPAAAAGKGAVQLALHERTGGEGYNDQGLGDKVGWAIANTNADGELIVQIHLDKGEPDQTFDVYVKINGKQYGPDDQLNTNRQGKGNAHVVVTIADYLASIDNIDNIDVQVVVKKDRVGYATATESVPLK